MKVHELRVTNFKRVEAATIEFPARGTVEVCGRNGQGKSSAIDAIWAALGGASASPEQPIRRGESRASVALDLGDLQVRREWDSRGTRLVVTRKGGEKVNSPQSLLSGLFDRLAFDPLEFTQQPPAKQAETLRKLIGLDLSALEQQRAKLYQDRTQVNAAVKQQEARVADLPDVEPCEPIDIAAMRTELRQASAFNAEIQRKQTALARQQEAIATAQREVDRLQAALEQANATLGQERMRLREMKEAKIPDPIDPDAILSRIEDAERLNLQARQHAERKAATAELTANKDHAQRLSDAIDDLDQQKLRQLAEATYPIEGLGLEGDTVTYRRVPFGQTSTSEQIRVSLAMSAALNPELRLIVIKEGSLLDPVNLELIAAWAQEHDYQVLVERVADSTLGAGVVIEEGRVKEASKTEQGNLNLIEVE